MSPAVLADPLRVFLSGKRSAKRHALEVPVTLGGAQGSLAAHTVDLSAGGVLLRIADPALGPEPRGFDVISRVDSHLGGGFDVVFPADQIVLEAEVVRLAIPPGEPDSLYVGARWCHPPTTEQLAALGIDERHLSRGMPLDDLPYEPRAHQATSVLVTDALSGAAGPCFAGTVVGLGPRALSLCVVGADPIDVGARLDGRALAVSVLRHGRAVWLCSAQLVTVRYVDVAGGGLELGLFLAARPPLRVRSRFRRRS
jgi:hypothetical protein